MIAAGKYTCIYLYVYERSYTDHDKEIQVEILVLQCVTVTFENFHLYHTVTDCNADNTL